MIEEDGVYIVEGELLKRSIHCVSLQLWSVLEGVEGRSFRPCVRRRQDQTEKREEQCHLIGKEKIFCD